MARIVREGFECRSVPMIFTTYAGTAAIDTTYKQTGAAGLNVGDHGSSFARKNLGAVYAETYHSFSFYFISAAVTVVSFYHWLAADGTTVLGSLRWNGATGKIQAYTGASTLVATGSKVLATATRYHIQVRIKVADSNADPDLTGRIQVAVDDDPASSLDIDFSGDTKPGADTGLQIIGFGSEPSGSTLRTAYVDDWAINDTAGGADDSWPGDVRLIPFYPNANGTTSGLTGSDGNQVSNYQQIDDLATGVNDGDTGYNKATASGQKDTYACTDPTIPDGAVFKAVIVEDISRKTNAAIATTLRAVVRSSGTDYTGTAHDLGSSYAKYQTEWLTDPAGGSWDGTKVNALEIGVEGQGNYA